MPQFSIFLSNRAEKGLRKAEPKLRERMQQLIEEMQINPAPKEKYDITKLAGSESNYRIRIGKYRVLYSILWKEKQIKIFDIDRRKERTYE